MALSRFVHWQTAVGVYLAAWGARLAAQPILRAKLDAIPAQELGKLVLTGFQHWVHATRWEAEKARKHVKPNKRVRRL